MEKVLIKNALAGKWVILGAVGGSLFYQKGWATANLINVEVFGKDGSGGGMLRIITDLTDEEMARLKYVRRIYWHWRGTRQTFDGKEMIKDQELTDRGIEYKEEPYIEYVKRPPHDKYL